MLGADDDRAWPAGCEPIHRTGSEVRDPMHARDSSVPKDGAHQDCLQLRRNNFDHRGIAHSRKYRGKSFPSVVRMSGARVGFANSGGLVFVDESAEEIAAA